MNSGVVAQKQAPTIDDLRVKTCYICLDEENYDDPPSTKSKDWVHPCKCTLIAHQSCLMKSLSRKRKFELKCPQCKFHYQVERNKNLTLACVLFDIGDRIVSLAGTVVFIVGAGSILGMAVSGVFGAGTAYGSWAVRQYFGDELFDMLLTEDVSNWPTRYFILFPLLSLRTMSRSMTGYGTFTPMFLWWPSMPPASVRQRLVEDSHHIQNVSLSSTRPLARLSTWPPSLWRFGWLVFASNMIYSRVFSRFSHWVLGAKPEPPQPRRGILNILTFGFLGRRGQRNQENPADEARARNQDQDREEENPPAREEIPFNLLEALTKVGELSVFLGLAKPLVAKSMGQLLYLASLRSKTLRNLLGIRQVTPVQMLMSSVPSPKLVPDLIDPELNNTWYWRYFTEQAVDNIDPVWIRNSFGLGLFVAVKDLLHLFHLWVTKRELASRRLKSRPFDNVDPAQLDLIQRPMTENNPDSTNAV
ncbi:hypothetical protein K435DRAFT_363268 [Dendrothele bispora CBS 962.96]|uniref:RING-CH-type domain-containing protein n=1 Tax=Dendrothele bispora (strain CBS 962.96) TaxID=1314807 RepID=A0A4S8LCG1_DENBC|nr:hypothetical protein K435DRAFT_363268 [Dendrothele bispora CBS 962.96]